MGALLGKGAGINDEDGGGVSQLLAGVAAQLGQDDVIVPLARADEVLHGLARPARLDGDGFASLALQAAETSLDHDLGQLPLLVAVEQGQVALQEACQVVAAAGNRSRCQGGVVEQRLRLGMVKEAGHGYPPLARDAPSVKLSRGRGHDHEKGLQ